MDRNQITQTGPNSFTVTPADFRPCDMDYSDEMCPSDCWYTGAEYTITYSVNGLEGRHVLYTCKAHVQDALDDLNDPRRRPYLCHNIVTTAL